MSVRINDVYDFPLELLQKYSILWVTLDHKDRIAGLPNIKCNNEVFPHFVKFCQNLTTKINVYNKHINDILELAISLDMRYIIAFVIINNNNLFPIHIINHFQTCLSQDDVIAPYELLEKLLEFKLEYFAIGKLKEIISAEEKLNGPSNMILLEFSSKNNFNIILLDKNKDTFMPVQFNVSKSLVRKKDINKFFYREYLYLYTFDKLVEVNESEYVPERIINKYQFINSIACLDISNIIKISGNPQKMHYDQFLTQPSDYFIISTIHADGVHYKYLL